MGFAEALSGNGSLTGRGHPWGHGLVCGAVTASRWGPPYRAFPDPDVPRSDDGSFSSCSS
jgi:hypothetical protein